MQLHDGQGKFTNHGVTSSYWCTTCTRKRGIHPPIPEKVGRQEGLFE